MNRSCLRISHGHIKPIVLAVALALPSAAALAQPLSDAATTRADQTIDQQYGRDSVYAFSASRKPMTPAQTGSASNAMNDVKAYSANAWDKTKTYSANAWDKTKAFLAPRPGADSPNAPQRYGRAGGYVGADQISFLHSDLAPTTAAPSPDTVKTGNGEIDRNSVNGRASETVTPSTPPEEHNGRAAGDRFDNPEGTRGQNENGG